MGVVMAEAISTRLTGDDVLAIVGRAMNMNPERMQEEILQEQEKEPHRSSPEKRRESQRQWYEKYGKQYREKHREQIAEYNRSYQRKHAEQNRERAKAYRDQNRDHLKAQRAAHIEENREKLAATQQAIKSLRKQYHLTQVDLAEMIGVHQVTISRWELGKDPADWEKLKIAFPDIPTELIRKVETA